MSDDVIERAARLLHALQWMGDQEDADAAWDRYPITSATRSDYLRTAEARAAAGLLAPSDTFASTKPSDAEHLLSVVETIKETGGSVQIRGVLITPCDTYGQPLTSVRHDADVAERIAQEIEADLVWDDLGRLNSFGLGQEYAVRLIRQIAARIAHSHATPPVATTGEGDGR